MWIIKKKLDLYLAQSESDNNIFLYFKYLLILRHIQTINKIQSAIKNSIVSTNRWPLLIILLSCMINFLKSWCSCHHRPAKPYCVPLIRIIQNFNINWSWLNKKKITFDLAKSSNFNNLSLTLFCTPFWSLSLNPLKRVEPPLKAILA